MNNVIKIIINEYIYIDVKNDEFDKILLNAIENATGVYAFRRLSHDFHKNPVIEWMKKSNCILYDKINIERISPVPWNEEIEIFQNEPVYFVDFSSANRDEFIARFKIYYGEIMDMIDMGLHSFSYLKNELFVLDPIYDQYDYIFLNGEHVSLTTFIHCMEFYICK